PEMEVSAASTDFQLRSVPCPHLTPAAAADSCAETGATGTAALAIPAWKRGWGGMFKPALHSLVFIAPLWLRFTMTFCPAFAVTGSDQMVFPSWVMVTW